MKNKSLKYSLLGILPVSMALAVLLGVPNLAPSQADAYNSVSLSKMNIDLNDTSANEIRSYYSALNSLNSTEKKGNNLLKNLKPILKNGQKYFNYDSGDAVWKLYEIVDRDWEKSPATENLSGTYNPSTNVIENYQFKKSGVDPYIHALYNDRSKENQTTAWSNHQQTARGINREHIWPKSHGFDDDSLGAGGARGDPMHLWAGDGHTNNMHSNFYYGYVDKNKTYKCSNQTSGFEYTGLNYTGTSLTAGSGTVFEPQDSDKGDIARAVFYMVARYNNLANETSGIDVNDPNLLLNDIPNLSTGTSTYNNPYYLGVLSDLLEWNKIDPPDEWEIHRNNLLYTNFTNNRNPFIDFPEWADICFDPNSTASADPISDSINGSGSTSKVVTGVQVATNPVKTVYSDGESFSSKGMTVKAVYSDGTTETVTDYSISPSGALTAGTDKVTISYEGKTTNIPITVISSSGSILRYFEKVTSDFTSGNYLITSNVEGVIWKNGKSGNANTISLILDDDEHIPYTSELGSALFTIDLSNGSVLAPNGSYIFNDLDSTTIQTSSTPAHNNISFTSGVLDISGGLGAHIRCNDNGGKPTFNYYKASGYSNYEDINVYRLVEVAQEVVHPEAITLSDSTLTLEIDESETLTATVLPVDTTNKSVVWASDNTGVATVDQNGRVVAHSSGTAHITATSKDVSTVFGSCTVTVPQPIDLDGLSLSGTYKTAYYIGDEFSIEGMTVNAIYKQGGVVVRTDDVTEDAEFSGFDSETEGPKTITVLYNGHTTSYDVTVSKVPYSENTVNVISSTLGYENGARITKIEQDDYTITFDDANTSTKYYSSGSAIRVYGGSSFTITGPYKIVAVNFDITGTEDNTFSVDKGSCDATTGSWSNASGEDKLTFTISGSTGHKKIVAFHVEYDPNSPATKELLSLGLSGYKTNFDKGDEFSTGSLVVTANYSDGSSAVVTPTSVTGYNMNDAGEQEVTVSYTENSITKSASYNIYVNEVIEVVSISLSGDYPTEFFVGDSFSRNGLVVTAHYSDTSSATVIPTSVTGYDMENPSNNQTITVSYSENGIDVFTTYSIKVKDIVPVSLEVSDIEQVDYVVGNEFNDTLTATVTYNNNTEKEVTPTTISGYDMSVVDEQTVTVSYTEKELTVSDTYSINVGQKTPVSLDISGKFSTNFYVGDAYSHDGLVATVTYDNGDVEVVTPTFSPVDMSTSGTKTITVSYAFNSVTVSDTYDIEVEAVLPTKIEIIEPSKKSFNVGETFTYEGLEVTATYNNGNVTKVTPTSVSSPDMTTAGTKEVTITYTYGGKSVYASYNIVVNAVVHSVSLDNNSINIDLHDSVAKTLTATVNADAGAVYELNWSVEDSSVISISENGNTVTITPLKVGSTKINVSAGEKSASCDVYVTSLVSSIEISGNNTIELNGTTNLSASVLPNDATSGTVHWSTSDSSILSIVPNGNNVAVTAQGSSGQSATITATAQDGSGKSDSITITIISIDHIRIDCEDVNNQGKIPFAKYASNETINATVKAVWTNGTETDITADAVKNFAFNCLVLGKQTISATYQGLSATFDITVTNEGSAPYVGWNTKTKSNMRAEGYNATPLQQAEAFADYFIKVTGGGQYNGICKMKDKDAKKQALLEVWDDLNSEYDYMVSDSKDEFCDENTSSTKIQEAMNHYKFICKNYGMEQFVEDSKNNKPSISSAKVLETVATVSITTGALLVAVGIVVIVLFAVRKKRKRA